MDPQLNILLNVVVASILSGIVGFEREKAQKSAGFRTNIIVGGTSCLLVKLMVVISVSFSDSVPAELIQIDPIRMIEAIIVGVSFIGGGTILKSPKEEKIKNLTTAATLLYSSGIGISVALDQFVLAAGLAVLAVIINLVLGWLESFVFSK